YAECPAERQRALVGEQCLQVIPVNAGHRDVEQAVLGLTGVVDRDDARVVEGRRHLRLAQEALPEVGLADAGREELQRRLPPEPDVLGAVDDARAATPERFAEAIASEL